MGIVALNSGEQAWPMAYDFCTTRTVTRRPLLVWVFRITWTTVLGKSYHLQTNALFNGSLSTNFVDASPLISAPADDYESTTNFLHLGGFNTNLPASYYRVRLVP